MWGTNDIKINQVNAPQAETFPMILVTAMRLGLLKYPDASRPDILQ